MGTEGTIVIVGGYGQVGQAVARALASDFPGRVVVAGRNPVAAEAFAATLRHGVRGVGFDVDGGDAEALLQGAAGVVMCVDPRGTGFVERCLRAGVDYVDVTAKQASLDAIEGLDALARSAGSTAVLSVGLAPGLTNLLAAWATSRFERVDRLDLFVLLGAGDAHGAAAIGWTLDNLASGFEVYRDGQPRRVQSFGEGTRVRLPGEARGRGAWRFNFPDQRTLARTLSIPTVSTWLCFEPRLMTSLIALAVRLGVARWLRVPWLRRALTSLLLQVHPGSDACAVMARVEGVAGGQRAVWESGLWSRKEAAVTGQVAAEVVRDLLAGNRPGGVRHLEAFMAPEGVLRRLEARFPETRLWCPSVVD
ncbi:saccharopine dehydrogenase family protein [Pyxidicoccus xibeiensis]|uniref:saccharopine dehydrogenase family protein n=1 Tax=Pyxidicoccus xibeiensis TaxID=2906759 RepID=UPI0020A79851|nr:saccharopine dehydrogenase NADP-binding domain-containing protein [Pyxidicoccus xibeiensis]MCP3141677.1 saccharopine dehydrogenase NADP-binding domain-containing protein [Pyxidicoccus xibeiensis]